MKAAVQRTRGLNRNFNHAARVHLRYDDRAAGLDHTETYECVFFPLTEAVKPEEAHVVDYDERDLRAEAPANAVYALPRAPIDKASFYSDLERQLKEHLYRTRTSDIFVNRAVDLYWRAGESRDEFIARCRASADDRADAESAKLREKYEAKRGRLEKQQRTAEHRVRELEVDTKQRVGHEIVAGAGQLLSVFLGGRRSLRSLSGAASRRGMTRRTQERLETAKSKVADAAEDLREIEEELQEDLAELQEKWDACAEEVETKAIPLDRSDAAVEEVVLLWVPVAR